MCMDQTLTDTYFMDVKAFKKTFAKAVEWFITNVAVYRMPSGQEAKVKSFHPELPLELCLKIVKIIR